MSHVLVTGFIVILILLLQNSCAGELEVKMGIGCIELMGVF